MQRQLPGDEICRMFNNELGNWHAQAATCHHTSGLYTLHLSTNLVTHLSIYLQ